MQKRKQQNLMKFKVQIKTANFNCFKKYVQYVNIRHVHKILISMA